MEKDIPIELLIKMKVKKIAKLYDDLNWRLNYEKDSMDVVLVAYANEIAKEREALQPLIDKML